ncbi:MAG: BrnA antitoxin family protein [Planctomycetota bacterium]|nr:BrnA antitoxin family protein [Planctomycetota bacterium]
MSAEEFERRFDTGEDISEFIDWESAHHPGWKVQHVSVDFPAWMVNSMDRVAVRLGVSRQALIKFVMNSYLQSAKAEHP